MSMTDYEYYSEVNRMARELYEEAVAEGCSDKDSIYDYFFENLPREVDGHSFIIYTYRNLEVLALTDNREAYFEAGIGPVRADSTGEVFQQLAYWALHQDVTEAFRDCIDVWLIDLPSEEEEEDAI